MGVLERSNAKLSEANAKFEAAHWEAVAAREDALNDKSERELRQQELEATNKRRQTIVDTVAPGVRPILSAMADAVKGWATLHPANKLVSSFRVEQLELLLETELLSADQKELLRSYLESRKAQANGSKEGNAQASEEGNQATQAGEEGNAQADREATDRQATQAGRCCIRSRPGKRGALWYPKPKGPRHFLRSQGASKKGRRWSPVDRFRDSFTPGRQGRAIATGGNPQTSGKGSQPHRLTSESAGIDD